MAVLNDSIVQGDLRVIGNLYANISGKSTSAVSAEKAASATKALQDDAGNTITSYYKPKQTALTASGGSNTKTITAITQDANGVISPTFANIRGATTGQTGITQLTNTIDGTTENKAITPKGVSSYASAAVANSHTHSNKSKLDNYTNAGTSANPVYIASDGTPTQITKVGAAANADTVTTVSWNNVKDFTNSTITTAQTSGFASPSAVAKLVNDKIAGVYQLQGDASWSSISGNNNNKKNGYVYNITGGVDDTSGSNDKNGNRIKVGDNIVYTTAGSAGWDKLASTLDTTNFALKNGTYTAGNTKLSAYSAVTAAAVPWSGITSKPSSYTPASHTHYANDILTTNLESKTSGLLALAKEMGVNGIECRRWRTNSDGGSVNITDRPVTSNASFYAEATLNRRASSADYRVLIRYWSQSDLNGYIAFVTQYDTKITWSRVNSNTTYTSLSSVNNTEFSNLTSVSASYTANSANMLSGFSGLTKAGNLTANSLSASAGSTLAGITGNGNFSAKGNVVLSGATTAASNISVSGNVSATGNFSAKGNITAANVTATNISATSNKGVTMSATTGYALTASGNSAKFTNISATTISGVTDVSATNIKADGLSANSLNLNGDASVNTLNANEAVISGATRVLGTLYADTIEGKISSATSANNADTLDGKHASDFVLSSDSRLTNSRTPNAHATSETKYGVGTTANYGHVKITNDDLSGATHTNGVVAGKAHTHGQYLTAHQSLANYVTTGTNQTITGLKTFSSDNFLGALRVSRNNSAGGAAIGLYPCKQTVTGWGINAGGDGNLNIGKITNTTSLDTTSSLFVSANGTVKAITFSGNLSGVARSALSATTAYSEQWSVAPNTVNKERPLALSNNNDTIIGGTAGVNGISFNTNITFNSSANRLKVTNLSANTISGTTIYDNGTALTNKYHYGNGGVRYTLGNGDNNASSKYVCIASASVGKWSNLRLVADVLSRHHGNGIVVFNLENNNAQVTNATLSADSIVNYYGSTTDFYNTDNYHIFVKAANSATGYVYVVTRHQDYSNIGMNILAKHDGIKIASGAATGFAVAADLTAMSTALGGAVDVRTAPLYASMNNHSHSNYVPTGRTVNGKSLSANVTLSLSDLSNTGHSHSFSSYTALANLPSFGTMTGKNSGDYISTAVDSVKWSNVSALTGTDASHFAKGNHTHSYLASVAWKDVSALTGTGATNLAVGNHTHGYISTAAGSVTFAQVSAITGTGSSNISRGDHTHNYLASVAWKDVSGLTGTGATNLAVGNHTHNYISNSKDSVTWSHVSANGGTTSAKFALGNHTHSNSGDYLSASYATATNSTFSGTAATAKNLYVNEHSTNDTTYYPIWANGAGGSNRGIYTTTAKLQFNPKSGQLYVSDKMKVGGCTMTWNASTSALDFTF